MAGMTSLKDRARRILGAVPPLHRSAKRIAGRLGGGDLWNRLDRFARRRRDRPVLFIQIGANDGLEGDVLREFILREGWRGLLVEPVPESFAKLKANYGGVPGLSFEQAAIAETSGRLPFYRVRDAGSLERRGSRLSSFNLESILSHRRHYPDIESLIEKIEIQSLSLADLMARHGIERPDLIFCDAEGYDDRIVAQIDLERHCPDMVVYESIHLSREAAERCRGKFTAAGYRIEVIGWDTIASRNGRKG